MKLFEQNIMVALSAVAVLTAALGVSSSSFNTAEASTTPNSKACPEGFTLSKGRCEMEPETTTELVCPDNLEESPLGNCIIGVGSPVGSVCPPGYPYQFSTAPPCGANPDGSGERVDRLLQCYPDYELDTTIPNVPRCFQVIPKVEQEVQEPCPDGSALDETRNLCVTKPGRNNNNRN